MYIFFIYYLKTEIAPHLERNDFLHIFTKTTISKKFLIFVQIRNFKNTFTFITTDTSKNGFIYLFKKNFRKVVSKRYQSVFIYFQQGFFIFCNISFLYSTSLYPTRETLIMYKSILLVFCFSSLQKNLDTLHESFLKAFLRFFNNIYDENFYIYTNMRKKLYIKN